MGCSGGSRLPWHRNIGAPENNVLGGIGPTHFLRRLDVEHFFLRDLTFVLEGLTFRFSKKLSEFKTGILSSAKQSALAPEPRVSCSGKWHAPGHKTEQDLTEL